MAVSSSSRSEEDRAQLMKRATTAVRSMLPPRENYPNVSPDLIAGLQKRDFKLASAITQQLVDDLDSALIETHIFPLNFHEGQALSQATLNPSDAVFQNDPVLLALVIRFQQFIVAKLGKDTISY